MSAPDAYKLEADELAISNEGLRAELSRLRTEHKIAREHEAQARAVAERRTAELAAVLADRDAAHARAEYLDSLLTVGVLGGVAAERKAQDAKWGEQNHPSFWPDRHYTVGREDDAKRTCDRRAEDGTIAYADIFVEEVAEVLGTIVQGSKEARRLAEARTRAELVQVAAVAVAWVEAIDRREVTQ